jgi:hypothetical protein
MVSLNDNKHSPEGGPRAKASGRSRWVSTSMATLPTPFTGYSTVPGLTELLRLYVCGLQPRPSVQLSSSTMSLSDNEYSWIPARASYRQLGRNDIRIIQRT